jgi:hypothetical protein
MSLPAQRRDILENEFKCGRISVAARDLGRRLARVFEQTSSELASNWPDGGGGGDPVARASSAAARRLERARAITETETDMSLVIGMAGVRFVRAILTGEHSFGSWALPRGWHGKRGAMDAAAHWRILIEDLAEHMRREHGQRRAPSGPASLEGTPAACSASAADCRAASSRR